MPGAYFQAVSKAGGQCMAMPDVCKVPAPPAPPVPTPFPNTGMCEDASKTVDKVLIENKEVVVQGSEIPSSHGDEAGTAGGVISNTTASSIAFLAGSS